MTSRDEGTRTGRDDRSPLSPIVSSPAAMVHTAEIPIVADARATRSSASVYDDDWYHERSRREAAPVGLRIAVWFLFFVFVFVLIGLAVEHYHPSWISFLRESIAPTARPHIAALLAS